MTGSPAPALARWCASTSARMATRIIPDGARPVPSCCHGRSQLPTPGDERGTLAEYAARLDGPGQFAHDFGSEAERDGQTLRSQLWVVDHAELIPVRIPHDDEVSTDWIRPFLHSGRAKVGQPLNMMRLLARVKV